MKIQNLDEAKACVDTWETLLKLEVAARSPRNKIASLSFAVEQGLALNLTSLGNIGITSLELEKHIRDLVVELLDKRAYHYLDRMHQLGIEVDDIEVQREEMINRITEGST